MELALLPASPPPAAIAAAVPPDMSATAASQAAASGPSLPSATDLIGGLWLLGFAAVVGRLLVGRAPSTAGPARDAR